MSELGSNYLNNLFPSIETHDTLDFFIFFILMRTGNISDI